MLTNVVFECNLEQRGQVQPSNSAVTKYIMKFIQKRRLEFLNGTISFPTSMMAITLHDAVTVHDAVTPQNSRTPV